VTQPDAIRDLLQSVATARLSPEAALEKLQQLNGAPPKKPDPFTESQGYESVGSFAKIDHQRTERTGFPEVIWGQDKTAVQITEIMRVMASHPQNHSVIMATRVDASKSAAILEALPQATYFEMARICAIRPSQPLAPRPGKLSILTAGTADLPVAEEAAVTAELCGFQVTRLWDVGVAGIHRLLSNRHVIEQADVLIVAAGMEGALPSVVAGLADCPVIALPTSIGYGASFNGLAPLLTMLNSCATGIGVVNIDNGFGAAILAGQILRTAVRISQDDGQKDDGQKDDGQSTKV
jgi:pyridinium-3,5-biscarboxylic acid mononucleotide synthase